MRDRSWAGQWLRQFKDDGLCMLALRQMLAQEASGWSLDRATDDEVIDRAASLLSSGIWHVHSPEPFYRALIVAPGAGAPAVAAAPEETAAADEAGLADDLSDRRGQGRQRDSGTKLTWIEIQLVDSDGKPVPGMEYEIRLPDGSTRSGALDCRGTARCDGIVPGQCTIRFPTLDANDWQPA